MELPDNIRIHLVFYIVLLEPVYTVEASRLNLETYLDIEEPKYKVEEIRVYRQ